MGGATLHHEPPIEIDGKWRKRGHGPHTDVERRVAYGLFHVEANIHFLQGVELRTVSLFKRDDGWLVMLKGQGKRHPMIAWLHGRSLRDALVILTTSADSSHIDWRVEEPRKPA